MGRPSKYSGQRVRTALRDETAGIAIRELATRLEPPDVKHTQQTKRPENPGYRLRPG